MSQTRHAPPIKLLPPTRGRVERKRPDEPASKRCTGECERELTICSFNVKTRKPWRRRGICRECQACLSQRSYERNKDMVISKSRIKRRQQAAANRVWLARYLADKMCTDCGVQAPDIFDFDHRHDDKRATVSKMVNQGFAIATIEAEIAKCDILCPNCHRKRTHADQSTYLHRFHVGDLVRHIDADTWESPSGTRHLREARHAIRYKQRNWFDNIAYLQTHPCVDCGEDDIRVLEYDHVRGIKEAELSYLIPAGASLERIARERTKCDVRCCNCHRRASHNVRPLASDIAS